MGAMRPQRGAGLLLLMSGKTRTEPVGEQMSRDSVSVEAITLEEESRSGWKPKVTKKTEQKKKKKRGGGGRLQKKPAVRRPKVPKESKHDIGQQEQEDQDSRAVEEREAAIVKSRRRPDGEDQHVPRRPQKYDEGATSFTWESNIRKERRRKEGSTADAGVLAALADGLLAARDTRPASCSKRGVTRPSGSCDRLVSRTLRAETRHDEH